MSQQTIPYNTIPQYTNSYHIPDISNIHKSVISQTRYLKFSVVVDSNRPYHAILYHTLKYQILPNTKYFTYRLPNNLNSHNSVSFKASSPKFCMVVYLHNTNRPYHLILYQKIPNNTKYQMPNISNSNKSVICQARSLKFCMIVDLDNTNKLYHTISYHTTVYEVIPNTKYFKQS